MRLEEFLFCEMARDESTGQLNLIGLYPGSLILVNLPESAPIQLLPNLYAVLIVGDMERVTGIRYQCEVKNEGYDIITTPASHMERPVPRPPYQNLIFGYSPFPCTRGPGDYEFRITVQPDGEAPTTYSKRFRIKRASKPAPVSTAQVPH
jgi:hypothetical protein